METRHSTCTGVPDVKSPQCYQCRELSVCTLLHNNLKTIERMFIHTQQVIETTCQTIIANLNRIAEQQKSHSEEMARVMIESSQQMNLREQEHTFFEQTSIAPYEKEIGIEETKIGEVIDANVKKGVIEKGKQIFGIIKS